MSEETQRLLRQARRLLFGKIQQILPTQEYIVIGGEVPPTTAFREAQVILDSRRITRRPLMAPSGWTRPATGLHAR